jgi:hypothetical protein
LKQVQIQIFTFGRSSDKYRNQNAELYKVISDRSRNNGSNSICTRKHDHQGYNQINYVEIEAGINVKQT